MSYQIKLKSPSKLKVSLGSVGVNVRIKHGEQNMAQSLNELTDVQITGNNDKYVLMYDSATGKWKNVNPDEVLNASATAETTQPGLPSDFINTLDVDLDNKIDLDAGNF